MAIQQTEEKTKCAHPACQCIVATDEQYCSQLYRDAGGGTIGISCYCEHPRVHSDSEHRRLANVALDSSSLSNKSFLAGKRRMLLDGYDEVDFTLLPRIEFAQCSSFGPAALILRFQGIVDVAI